MTAPSQNISTNQFETFTFDTYEEWNLWIDLIEEADIIGKRYPEKAEEKYKEAGEVLLRMAQAGISADHFHPSLFAGLCFERNPETASKVYDAYYQVMHAFQKLQREQILPSWTHQTNPFELLNSFIFAAPKHLEASFAALQVNRKDAFAQLIDQQVHWITELAESPELRDLEEIEYLTSYAYALYTVLEEFCGQTNSMTKRTKKRINTLCMTLTNQEYYEAMLSELLAIYRADPELSVAEMRSLLTENHLPKP